MTSCACCVNGCHAEEDCGHFRRVVLYVAGPYRADTPQGIAWNVAQAELAGMELMRAGYDVLVPHTLSRMDWCNEHGDARWLETTLNLMLCCHAVVRMPRWAESVGTKAEVEAAIRANMPLYDLADLIAVPDNLLRS